MWELWACFLHINGGDLVAAGLYDIDRLATDDEIIRPFSSRNVNRFEESIVIMCFACCFCVKQVLGKHEWRADRQLPVVAFREFDLDARDGKADTAFWQSFGIDVGGDLQTTWIFGRAITGENWAPTADIYPKILYRVLESAGSTHRGSELIGCVDAAEPFGLGKDRDVLPIVPLKMKEDSRYATKHCRSALEPSPPNPVGIESTVLKVYTGSRNHK